MKRRLIVGALASSLLTVATLAGTLAVAQADDWCDTDPTVVIKTPQNNTVVVFVSESALGTQHLDALKQSTITQTVTPGDGGTTNVTLDVFIANDAYGSGFPVRSTATSRPNSAGTIYDSESGQGGQHMLLQFRLDVS